jgi:group I intron endonuclease
MTYGIIYQAFDTSNGKSYIGQTTRSLEIRKNEHWNEESNSRKFKNAFRLRPKAFVWNILTTCYNFNDLNVCEMYWIRFFNSIFDGYNLREGGQSGGKMSDESRQLMSLSKIGNQNGKGHRRSKEQNELVSQKLKKFYENRDPFSAESREKARQAKIGKKHSEETKKKMSLSQKKRRFHERKLHT